MTDVTINFHDLPADARKMMAWTWSDIEPYFQDLESRALNAGNIAEWLGDWSAVTRRVDEAGNRLYVAHTLDTRDEAAEKRYLTFIENVIPPFRAASQKLKEKLLAGKLQVDGFAIALRNMKAEAKIFREANLPLFTDEKKLGSEYDKVMGAQTVTWEGKEVTVSQLQPIYLETNRNRREKAWRLATERQLADRDRINALWEKFMSVRGQLAANAGFPNFRAFRWRQSLRFDYTPRNCEAFNAAILRVVVPAASQLYKKRRKQLGVKTLRPWDLAVDPLGRPALKPFKTVKELEETAAAIFDRVDPELGKHFAVMRAEKLLDLDNRKGKAPGGYCTTFAQAGRPFVFMNAVGIHDDVQTLLHEAGHSFHVFESNRLPYEQQKDVPMEFAEVASMAMELLAAPYLAEDAGGYYAAADAARARAEHLERSLMFWPYMAVVDSFQHWVYLNPAKATNPDNCDEKWSSLWQRFMPDADYTDFEDVVETGWHRKLHIHLYPFYYVEYGLAQLGAIQIWRRALENQTDAVAGYRRALALGGTAKLPELYATAGAQFAFDAVTLKDAVDLVTETLESFENA